MPIITQPRRYNREFSGVFNSCAAQPHLHCIHHFVEGHRDARRVWAYHIFHTPYLPLAQLSHVFLSHEQSSVFHSSTIHVPETTTGVLRVVFWRPASAHDARRFDVLYAQIFGLFSESLSQNTTMPFACCVPAAQRDNTIPKRVGRMSHPAAAEVPPRLFEPFPMNNGKALLCARGVSLSAREKTTVSFCSAGPAGWADIFYFCNMYISCGNTQHKGTRRPLHG